MASTEISASDYGVVGDDSTDNATALIAMRDAILADNTKHYRIVFDVGGTFQYTNNRWLRGIRSFELIGNGATFKPVGLKTWTRDGKPLLIDQPFEDYGDTDFPNPPNAYVSGYLFDTVDRGSNKITCTTPADASNMQVGQWCIIFGFLHQYGGFPPNLRFFEFKKIDNIDPVTGEVSFDTTLRYDYDATWFDLVSTNSSAGKPRILPFEGANNVVPIYARLENATFLRNPDDERTGAGSLGVYGRKVVFDGVTAPKMTIAISDSTIIRSGRFDSIEVDKLCRIGVINGAECLGSISAATGAHQLQIKNCVIDGNVDVSPINRLIVDGCTIKDKDNLGHIRNYAGGNSTTLDTQLTNNSLYGLRGPAEQIQNINANAFFDMPIDDTSPPPSTDILLDQTESNFNTIRRIQVGTPFISKSSPSKGGVVTNISYNGSQHVISGTWSNYGGFIYPLTTHLSETGTQYNDVLSVQSKHAAYNNREVVLTSTEVPVSGNVFLDIYGFFYQIIFTVKVPYTGFEPSPVMYVRQRNNGATVNEFMRVDVKEVGTRIVQVEGSCPNACGGVLLNSPDKDKSPIVHGLFGSDRASNLGMLEFTEQLLFVGQKIIGTADQLPEYEIRIQSMRTIDSSG